MISFPFSDKINFNIYEVKLNYKDFEIFVSMVICDVYKDNLFFICVALITIHIRLVVLVFQSGLIESGMPS